MNYFKQLAIYALILSNMLLLPQDNGLLTRYLEPRFPHLHPQKIWWSNCLNVIMSEELRTPIFDKTNQIIQISFDTNKNAKQKSEEIKLLVDSWVTKFYDPLSCALLFSSPPVAEYVIEPSLNYLFPNNPIHTLFTDNQMMVMGRLFLRNTIVKMPYFQEINARICNNTLPQEILATISSIGILCYAHTIRPDLFEHWTYFNVIQLVSNKNQILDLVLKGILDLVLKGIRNTRAEIKKIIEDNTTIYNYSLFDLLKNVETIFDAKQQLFLLSIIFGCFFIKTKKNIYTNPAYWLPIGILHALYTKKQYGITIEKTTRKKSWLGSNNHLMSYACHNAIPILAILVNTVLPT